MQATLEKKLLLSYSCITLSKSINEFHRHAYRSIFRKAFDHCKVIKNQIFLLIKSVYCFRLLLCGLFVPFLPSPETFIALAQSAKKMVSNTSHNKS